MKIEITPIDNGTLVEYTKHMLSGARVWFYADWNEAISAAQHLLEEQRYVEDESQDPNDSRRETK